MLFSKIRFEPKEVLYIIAGIIAYVGQLTHLSNKIDDYKYRTDLRLQATEFRINVLEGKPVSAILPRELEFETKKNGNKR